MSICPPQNLAAEWAPPDRFDGYPQAIRDYLSQGGATANLLTILRQASSINEKWGGVFSIDLSGDGEPETIVSIIDPFSADQPAGPGGMLLIYGCENRQVGETRPAQYERVPENIYSKEAKSNMRVLFEVIVK